jgi:hypothetical protein
MEALEGIIGTMIETALSCFDKEKIKEQMEDIPEMREAFELLWERHQDGKDISLVTPESYEKIKYALGVIESHDV